MKIVHSNIHRRAFLRGAFGASIALPLANFSLFQNKVVASETANTSKRLVTFYFPNGCAPEYWNYNNALQPLVFLRDKICVLSGLHNSVSEAFGGDPHAQGGVTLFTGSPINKSNQRWGESIDQLASRQLLDTETPYGKPLVTGCLLYTSPSPRDS